VGALSTSERISKIKDITQENLEKMGREGVWLSPQSWKPTSEQPNMSYNSFETIRTILTVVAIILIVIFLTRCTSLEKTLGVHPDDNAILCVKASTGATGAIFTGGAAGSRIEVPGNVDTTTWTVDDITALLEACD
jgi:hypothetical protein|tara:strand:- start:1355 stop:1762 length:408 start_codon:yes stop_codon:yes gene_type:complete